MQAAPARKVVLSVRMVVTLMWEWTVFGSNFASCMPKSASWCQQNPNERGKIHLNFIAVCLFQGFFLWKAHVALEQSHCPKCYCLLLSSCPCLKQCKSTTQHIDELQSGCQQSLITDMAEQEAAADLAKSQISFVEFDQMLILRRNTHYVSTIHYDSWW